MATAVAAARKRAGIDETLPLEIYPHERGLLARLGMGGVQTLLPYGLGHEFARLQRLAQMRGVQVQALATVPSVQ